MDAFHSSPDISCELSAPGLYIVAGHIFDPFPHFNPVYAVDRTKRFPLEPADVLDWPLEPDLEWDARVTVEGVSRAVNGNGVLGKLKKLRSTLIPG